MVCPEAQQTMTHSPPAEVLSFITAAKEKGASYEAILGMLESEGWPRAEIWRILTRHYESLSGVKVPVGRKSTTPAKDAFLYLLAFSTLATWTIATGSICFILIENWIPDPLAPHNYGQYMVSQMSSELAAVVVRFPLFLLGVRGVLCGARRAPGKEGWGGGK